MQAVTTVGLDIAKSVFQVHGVDAAGQVVIRRQLKRRYVLAFFEKLPAVPGGHRSLCLIASLVAGAQGARPYGAVDAAGLREALRQTAEERCHGCGGNLRSGYQGEYAVRRDQDAPEQQSGLTLHRTRHLLIRQQTALINVIRAHLAEFGIVAPVGRKGVEELLNVVTDASDKRLPVVARMCLAALGAQLRQLKESNSGVRPYDHGLASIA